MMKLKKSHKNKEQKRMQTIIAFIQHCTGSPSQCNKARKISKKYKYEEGREKKYNCLP